MFMVVDPNKTGLENMYALISATAGISIDETDILLGPPTVWKSIYAGGRNTSITASRAVGSDYNGPLQFYYRRENLARYEGTLNRGIPLGTVVDETVLTSILSSFGIIPEECNFGTVEPNLSDDGKYHVTVIAKPGSYTYQGRATLLITPESVILNARLLENGDYRLLEDGTVRKLE